MNMVANKERRKYKRMEKDIELFISKENLSSYKKVNGTKNVSPGGISVINSFSLGVGLIRSCKIKLPGYDDSLESVIKVVWEKKLKDESYQIGMKFVDFNEAFQRLLGS